MDEVRHPSMDSVVMALMAERESVADVMPQLWMSSDWLHVVRLEPLDSAAVLTDAAIAFEHGRLPREVFGATPALIVAVVDALRSSLASLSAVGRLSGALARATGEIRSTLRAGVDAGVAAAGVRAVHRAANVRRRAFDLGPAGRAVRADLLRLVRSATWAGAEALLSVFRPTSVCLLGDCLTAGIAGSQFVVRAHTLDLSKAIDRNVA